MTMNHYTIQVSDLISPMPRPDGKVGHTQAQVDSWQTVFDGKASARDVRAVLAHLGETHLWVQSFRGAGTIGRLWYWNGERFT